MKLVIDNVSKNFIDPQGKQLSVLENVSLTVHSEEFVALVGPSGCGKTTLLNIIGGLWLDEPAADLAAVVALASSYLDRPVPRDLVAIGEVGLTGELRTAAQLETRIRECVRLGYRRILIPKSAKQSPVDGATLVPVSGIREAIDVIRYCPER